MPAPDTAPTPQGPARRLRQRWKSAWGGRNAASPCPGPSRTPSPLHPAWVRLAPEQKQPDRLQMRPPTLHLLRDAVDVSQPPLERLMVEDRRRAGLMIDAVR